MREANPLPRLAKELGIDTNTVCRWVREYRGMSDQFFVDINRDLKLYYINVFKVDRYGHTKMLALENTDFAASISLYSLHFQDVLNL